jgi:hypothetical protein
MVFQEHRRRAQQSALQWSTLMRHEMLRLPAGFRTYTAGALERHEKFMTQKGIAFGAEGVPVIGGNYLQAVCDTKVHATILNARDRDMH